MQSIRYIVFIPLMALFFVVFSCKSDNKSKADSTKVDEASDDFNAEKATDEELLNRVQEQTFNYFWEGAEPNSGLARERLHMDDVYPTSPKNTVTIGGSGFGFMALLVGIKRGFITREQGFKRFQKMVSFLEKADRFHGAWPHWLNGETGKVLPFSKKDNGGDLVETSFLIEGMLTVSEYFKNGNDQEQALSQKINTLWEEVEWDWYTKGENVLYWHWSPNYKWEMNFPVSGYNECLIMYILAAASPTHSIDKKVYTEGWARNDSIISSETMYGHDLILDYYGNSTNDIGPLFWSHYSFTGLNPKGLSDKYANYWDLVRNQALIHYDYAIENPLNYKGYGKDIWGMTSSYSVNGYSAHRPGKEHDLGVITPTAALSSFPYTPKESMQMLRSLYKDHDSLIGKYGPYDAFSFEDHWYSKRYLAIDEGPIPVMVENYRSGMLWDLFMRNEDVQHGLEKLGFTHN